MPNNTAYPAKTRSAAVDRVMPGRSRTAEVDQVTRGVGVPSQKGGMKDGRKPKKGAMRRSGRS